MTLGMAPRSFELQGTAVLQDDKERVFHTRPPEALQSVLQEDCSRTNGSDRLLVGLVQVCTVRWLVSLYLGDELRARRVKDGMCRRGSRGRRERREAGGVVGVVRTVALDEEEAWR